MNGDRCMRGKMFERINKKFDVFDKSEIELEKEFLDKFYYHLDEPTAYKGKGKLQTCFE
ncbi:hypothetical protein Hanom_Chr13g01231671 [Helianthus anomalus]